MTKVAHDHVLTLVMQLDHEIFDLVSAIEGAEGA